MLVHLTQFWEDKKKSVGLLMVSIVLFVYVTNPLEVTVVGTGEVTVPTKSLVAPDIKALSP